MNISDIYREAFSTHRHYDNLSQAAITSIAAIIGATPLAYDRIKEMPVGGLGFWGGAVLLWLAFNIYSRFDAHAGMALKFAEFVEQADMQSTKGVQLPEGMVYGVAHAFHHRSDFKDLSIQAGGFVYRRVRLIVWTACVIFVVSGALVLVVKAGWMRSF